MSKFIEPAKELPIYGKYDTVVVGGGFAGVAAAVAAARGGNKVLLCEKMFILGGLGTSGLVTIYLPLCDGRGNQLSYGLAEELLKVSIEHGHEESTPCALPPLIVGLKDVQPRLQGQGLMFQLAKSRCHSVNSQGSRTSRPDSSFREISDASCAWGSLESLSSRK